VTATEKFTTARARQSYKQLSSDLNLYLCLGQPTVFLRYYRRRVN